MRWDPVPGAGGFVPRGCRAPPAPEGAGPGVGGRIRLPEAGVRFGAGNPGGSGPGGGRAVLW